MLLAARSASLPAAVIGHLLFSLLLYWSLFMALKGPAALFMNATRILNRAGQSDLPAFHLRELTPVFVHFAFNPRHCQIQRFFDIGAVANILEGVLQNLLIFQVSR